MDIWADATALTEAIRDRRIGSEELLDALLVQVERYNPAINAVVALDIERARALARQADEAVARGETWGPLHGLPMTVKDSIETEGVVTTSGSPDLRDHVPDRDAATVARLKAAGAIVFGKTNLPTFAADFQSYNDVYGTTNNPWDLSRTPGGSSGGAAAAVAVAMSPMELGSDIGGSIRIPASFTGVTAIKPSFGVVPSRGHIPGPPGSLSRHDIMSLGPIARSVRDLELALDVIAGPDETDSGVWHLRLPAPRADGTDLHVAVLLEHESLVTSSTVRSALGGAVDRLVDAGVKVEEANDETRALVAEAAEFSLGMVTAATSLGLPDAVFELMCDVVRQGSEAGESRIAVVGRQMVMRHREWLRRNEQREQLRARWAAWFADIDVLLAPVFPTAAFPHQQDDAGLLRTMTIDGLEHSYWQSDWCTVFGLVYLPAACVPAATTEDGLPVGLQVVGPYLNDRTVLAGARLIEERLGGFVPPPGFAD